jgi:hypothetical protein
LSGEAFLASPITAVLTSFNHDQVKLRNKPGSDPSSQVEGLLPRETQFHVLARTADSQWLKIETPDGTGGWVDANAVGLSSEQLDQIPVATTLTRPIDAPVINVFDVMPSEIEKGGTVALIWDVSNAEQIELTEPVQETLPGKSGVKTYIVDQSTNFTLRATNFAGEDTKSITVKLKGSAPVILDFRGDPAAVMLGRSDKVTLSWTVAGADAVSIEGVPGTFGVTGSVAVDPPQADKTYTLNATNSAGTVQQQVTIRVASAGCTIQSATKMREGPA